MINYLLPVPPTQFITSKLIPIIRTHGDSPPSSSPSPSSSSSSSPVVIVPRVHRVSVEFRAIPGNVALFIALVTFDVVALAFSYQVSCLSTSMTSFHSFLFAVSGNVADFLAVVALLRVCPLFISIFSTVS